MAEKGPRRRGGAQRRVAIALGGGGARGIAHIAMLEALDELGVVPVAIAGTSMGALFGALYAAGHSAREIREIAAEALADQRGVMDRLRQARAGRLVDLVSGLGNPFALDAEAFCASFLPPRVPATFEECPVPLSVVATDFFGRRETVFQSGPLRRAVAASIAIPGLVRPVEIDGRLYIDGAAVNPLPLDHLRAASDVVVAVDVTGGPVKPPAGRLPASIDVMFGALQILQEAIIAEKIARHAPDIMVRPNVNLVGTLDFFRASLVFRLAGPAKEELKRKLAAALEQG
jgi:NTE family protein